MGLHTDFSDPEKVEPIVGFVVEKLGGLDVLVNNAGFEGTNKKLEDLEFHKDFQSVLQVNLIATTRLAHLAVPHLMKSHGIIINVSSAVERVSSCSVSQRISRAGFSELTVALANALGGKDVRVVGIAIGPIASGSQCSPSSDTSLGRLGRPDEVTALIAYVSSAEAEFIHGATLAIDGGFMAKIGLEEE